MFREFLTYITTRVLIIFKDLFFWALEICFLRLRRQRSTISLYRCRWAFFLPCRRGAACFLLRRPRPAPLLEDGPWKPDLHNVGHCTIRNQIIKKIKGAVKSKTERTWREPQTASPRDRRTERKTERTRPKPGREKTGTATGPT